MGGAALLLASACGSNLDTVASAVPPAQGDAASGEPGGGSADAGMSAPPITLDGGGGVTVTPTDQCNEVELSFEPQIPSVFILVDRSSSMFERGLWDPLKSGVLAIVEQLDKDIRFGFASYTGVAGGMCPDLAGRVLVAEDNYDAIKRAYDAIEAPKYKGETPTSRAIDEVSTLLAAQPAGPKFILLVTDGEPDFCDDPNVTCSRDAVVASVQAAHAQGIGSFIFSVGGSVDRAHLQDAANAGRGEGVQDRQQAVFYQCNGGKATYGAAAGSAPFFEPNVQDQKALVDALSSVVAGVRSCVFELSGKLEIDLNAANLGMVEIDGMSVPFGAPDGFRMNSPTQVELLGASCARLRRPETRNVSIDFPCKAVIVL
ncbi:MAG TPA: vWA domain-containing protein [Polyangiales bacterium]